MASLTRTFLVGITLALLTIGLASTTASARTLSVPIGSKATWVLIDSGERLVEGRTVGRVAVDVGRIREVCQRSDEDFEGYVQLRRVSRGVRPVVEFRCLKRADAAAAGRGDDA